MDAFSSSTREFDRLARYHYWHAYLRMASPPSSIIG
jgi:hypothetical protein